MCIINEIVKKICIRLKLLDLIDRFIINNINMNLIDFLFLKLEVFIVFICFLVFL